ncbi:MAG TPA: 50S ribosomal protein L29 [Patescibacteria group bacterium]|nr:50S ribosomal protein L29 [Patescibacteria group bacterium]
MDFKELQKKENEDLQQLLAQNRDKLRELRFKDANKQLKDVRQIRKARKDIARVLTILNNRKNK